MTRHRTYNALEDDAVTDRLPCVFSLESTSLFLEIFSKLELIVNGNAEGIKTEIAKKTKKPEFSLFFVLLALFVSLRISTREVDFVMRPDISSLSVKNIG